MTAVKWWLGMSLMWALGCGAQPGPGDLAVQAREAWVKRDRPRLASLADTARRQNDPLAGWVDYFDLNARMAEIRQPDMDAFYARYPGSYVEDRLRNDWLLELGRRRDWANFRRDHVPYQMRDDREVACYALLADHAAGSKVATDTAREAWMGQKDGDDGCQQLAKAMLEAGQFKPDTVWAKARLAIEQSRPRAARQAVALLGSKPFDQKLAELQDNAGRYLTRKARTSPRAEAELTALALARVAANDPEQAGDLLGDKWSRLPADLQAWLWAQIGRQSALRLRDDAMPAFERAAKLAAELDWSDDTLAWAARAALRAKQPAVALRAIEKMSPAEQRDPAWVYWKARATRMQGDAPTARAQLAAMVASPQYGPLNYFGRLAAEDLGLPTPLPSPPAPLTAEERRAARQHPGLTRGLQLIEFGLRSEGVREWNFSLRGMGDRALLAAAQEACDREVWDRCINTSERTKTEIDIAQRYPLPFRTELQREAQNAGLDPAYVYGLIRQESRFVLDARSHVGASGLMQVMPATAKWTAKKAGLDYSPARIHDRDFNLRIGTHYLKLVLDRFDGAQALAAAAYNAGPGRPARWRDGPVIDAAIWAENIPFTETRDYVRKVLLGGAVYAQVLGLPATRVRERLGASVGPAGMRAADVSDVPPAAAGDAKS
ncbi:MULTISPECIES: lytic transglycosylase domain-containing protein [unclassified Roseateles]|uniref:lytic transglycosylase domain-containing protein n=1 Tax=unclassified Roseateles TaxID=2626991 RepID=UPI0006F4EFD0|nr:MULTISPECIES: lytic transglycosylase domain-containing protein [unclassified Roseateles]KQW51269.1 lytic transglycosylase [Pelomonas sp. Root405]KRA77501.1 lytic transglycosylase [Pelomonas sp. Root662]